MAPMSVQQHHPQGERTDHGAEALAVAGCTGSLGRVVCNTADRLGIRLCGLAGWADQEGLAELVHRFSPGVVACQAEAATGLREAAERPNVLFLTGEAGVERVAAWPEASHVAVTIGGWAGLRPAMAALQVGHRLLMGCKEALVGAGPLLLEAAERTGASLAPLDSEMAAAAHLASLAGGMANVRELVLTGSGGPLRGQSPAERASATFEQVLRHPIWPMGKKITVDSATLVNKALEIVEAAVLFDLPGPSIRVGFDPGARVHAAVRLHNGQTLAFVAPPSMDIPVLLSLKRPCQADFEVLSGRAAEEAISALRRPDAQESRILDFGYRALEQGGMAPAALVLADERAVARYLDGRIPLGAIVEYVAGVMRQPFLRHLPRSIDLLEAAVVELLDRMPDIP